MILVKGVRLKIQDWKQLIPKTLSDEFHGNTFN